MNLLYLIFIIIFFIFVIDSDKIRPNFDEIFGNGWDKKESEQTVKIEQNERNENSQSAAVDQMGEEMGNDRNDQMKNDHKKREIILKFEAIKEKLKEKGKYKSKDQYKIERTIAKLLGAKRKLIHKWKNELNLNKNKIKKNFYDEKKREFIERFDEFKELYAHGKQKEFVKELGISNDTFWKWKKELVPKYNKKENKLRKLKQYYEIKESNPKMCDEIIAKKLGISRDTLRKWKKRFAKPLIDQ